MGIATLKKDYDPCITEQPEGTEGWLITRQYAAKYKLSVAYVHELRNGGKLTHKECNTTYGKAFLFPDIPLKRHPGYKSKVIKKKKKTEQRKANTTAHPATARTLEGRKKKLVPYLEKFKENAPLDQGFFGGLELKEIVQASNFMFYTTWHSWGLISRAMPGGKRNEKVYYRSDIVRFLQGNFDNDGGPANRDDKVLEETLGTVECPNDNYYHYDPKKVYDLSGDGCIQWIYDKKICLLNQRSKKWEPITLLDFQEEFIHRALATKDDGDLKHKIAIACWKRGEGKSMCVKLIGLFLFFNLRGQKIVFSGSSKDQADKVLFTELKEIVQKTPELAKMVNYGMEVQEARIILRSGPKSIECELVPVATATGLLTGTTAAFFTELHEQKDCKFFEDLYSSLRGVPNAIALVDTTVADKGHIVHKLWDAYRDGDPMVFFDYNGSKTLSNRNPEITKEYLEHQKRILLPATFRKYFFNLWDDVNTDTLSADAIRKFGIAGVKVSGGEIYGQSQEMDNLLTALMAVEGERDELVKQKVDATHLMASIRDLEAKFILMDHLYSIPATADDVANIEKLFKTSLSIFIGMDRAGMTRKGHDRTVMPCFGIGPLNEITNIVFLLDMFIPLDDSMPVLQERIINWKNEFGLIEKITLEKYETKDLARWCEDTDVCNEVAYSEAYPSIPRKREIFVPAWQYMSNGYFKAPTVPYYVDDSGRIHEGFANKADIFCEEASVFIFDEERGVFRAQEKGKGRVGTVKDDTMYGAAWGISGSAGTDLMTSGEMRGTADLYGIDINANTDTIGNYDSFGDYSGNIGDY